MCGLTPRALYGPLLSSCTRLFRTPQQRWVYFPPVFMLKPAVSFLFSAVTHPHPPTPTSSRTMSSALDGSTFCGCVSAARAGVVLLEYSLFHATSPPCAPILPSSCPSFSLPAGVCLDGEIVGEVYLDNIYPTV